MLIAWMSMVVIHGPRGGEMLVTVHDGSTLSGRIWPQLDCILGAKL